MKWITDHVRICQHYKFEGDNCKCCVYWMETLKGITMIDWGYNIVFTKISKKEDTKCFYAMIKLMLKNIITWMETKNVKYQYCETVTQRVKLWILFLNFLECDNIILMRNSVNLQNLKKWNERTVFGEKPTLRTYVQHSVIIITSRVLLEIKPIIENLVSEMNSISTVKWTIKVFRCFNPQIKKKKLLLSSFSPTRNEY